MRLTVIVLIGVLVASLALAGLGPAPAANAAIPPACDTPGAPTTTVYLPNITKTLGGPQGWVTPFIVQNVGFVQTTLEVSFYRFSDGAFVTCRRPPRLAVGTSFADVPNNDTDLPDNSQFSVVVRSFGSEIVAVVNEHAGVGSRAEALSYVGLSEGATRVALPYVAKSVQGWLTTIIVQNLGSVPTNVTASFVSFDGTKTATLTRSVGPGRSRFIDPSVEPSLANGTEYAVMLSASQPIAAVVNAHNDAPAALRPMGFSYNGVVPDWRGYSYVPYVARNVGADGRSSRIVVQNAGTSSATPTLELRPFGGGAPVTVTAPAPLAPGASWSFDPRLRAGGTTACPAAGDTGCVREGEHGLVVYGTDFFSEFAVLNVLLTAETAMGHTGSGPSRSRVYLPNVTRTLGGPGGWTTPIIVQSAGATSASLRWYRFSDGAYVTRQTMGGLVPGSSVRVDPRTVPGLSDNTQYAVVLDARDPIVAIVEELAGGGGDSVMLYEGFASPVEAQAVPTIVAVSPASLTLGLGGVQQLSASVTDQFGTASTWPVGWYVSPETLGTFTREGRFTATGYGSGTITARAGASAGSITVTVQGPPPRPPAVATEVGHSTLTVETSRGAFYVNLIKEPLSSVTVRTLTANDTDCAADCPAKPLVEFLNDAGAFAGMNGSYLCPPDYSWCAGKVNSYDYAVYNSLLGKWLNPDHLDSPTNALVTFSATGTPRFYRYAHAYDRSAVAGAISNFPVLLLGGAVVDSEAEQADYQKQRGMKGSIGTDGTYLYLTLVSGASVTDSAYVLQALGAQHAMNLDGGGTSAMFHGGGYKVGPGRQLANAVVLVRR